VGGGGGGRAPAGLYAGDDERVLVSGWWAWEFVRTSCCYSGGGGDRYGGGSVRLLRNLGRRQKWLILLDVTVFKRTILCGGPRAAVRGYPIQDSEQ
jgi:hypothetical protein